MEILKGIAILWGVITVILLTMAIIDIRKIKFKRSLARVIRYTMIKKLRKGIAVSVFASWKCNYQCDYCLLRTGGVFPESETLSLDSWKEFLNKLDAALCNSGGHGIKEISLVGGEPTLLPYFVDLCHWILFEKRWQLMIYTNLSNLKMLKVKPSLLLRVEATYHYRANHMEFYHRYKRVNNVHRVIPRQLLPEPDTPLSKLIEILPYTHKDFICVEEKDKDINCPLFIRIAPDQTIHMTYGEVCERKIN